GTGVKVVIGGRYSVARAWRGQGVWPALTYPLPLGNFTSDEAHDYLERRGLTDVAHRQQLVNLTAGHPLALSLAVDLAPEPGRRNLGSAPEWHLTVRTLVDRFLRDVADTELPEFLDV